MNNHKPLPSVELAGLTMSTFLHHQVTSNVRYIDTNLSGYVGESVTIRYDPRDLAQISVFFQEQFLCHATCEELSGHTISLKEIIKARRRKKRTLTQVINRRQQLLNEVLDKVTTDNSTLKKRSKLKRYHND